MEDTMMLRTTFLLWVFLFCGSVRETQAQTRVSFSPLVELNPDDAHHLYYLFDFLSRERGDLDAGTKRKVKGIRSMVGSVGELPKDPAVNLAEYSAAQRRIFYPLFTNEAGLVQELKKSAGRLGELSNPEAKKMAALLYDTVLSLSPGDGESAYQRELLIVNGKIDLPWLDSGEAIYRFEIENGSHGVLTATSINGLNRNQALIKGLLVQELRGSQFLGEASQMNATVILNGNAEEELKVNFNQRVGSSMTQAVVDMMDFHRKRQSSLPTGVSVEISFEEQYIPKDGPSAGVASALLLESLFTGHSYDMGFAVTGAMDGEGKVGAVGGVDGKIRGAITRRCSMVAIPLHNEATVRDLLILEGPASLAKIQVIGITVFDDALKLAIEEKKKDPKIKTALATFSEVQKILNQRGGMGYLPNPKVQSKLRSVVQAIPTHFSAKYLLLKAMGRNPTSLSLIGSVQAIDRNAAPLIRSLESGNFEVDKLGKDNFGKAIGNLKRVRPLLDSRCRPCADAIVDYSGYIRKAINSWPSSRGAQRELIGQIRAAGAKVGQEYDNLYDRDDVKKELLQD